ncbi:DHA2 family efflux MFS transporter permease subunit [Clostridium sp. 'White wine YQ']|uniref:DHA2 family efflux MFS transporter permease subunit n=1 Tax=Clostridium sp. 'White wine YQ' TaxID=3027474 RepID=UPI002365EAE5|nr:DHA2 family efflux MFS transporter permease subunit [Clostridium sp. 'White wine YQ']MDD7793625.1 DHA2 family efflux MFS transporter permease subunit [Clostridium sp. 'White wine YQ']
MNRKEKVLAFISLAIACFLTVLDGTIVNVSLPSMASYFNTNITGISWVSTSYLIPFSALLINFSKIADIYGRKKLFLIGLFIFGISSVCCGLSTSLPMIIFFRIIQGIGAAILTPLAIPLGIELFGKDAMGKLAILIGMIISISAASGPVLGGVLNEAFNFKAIFYVNIPFILIALFLGKKYVVECYDRTIEKKVDIVGSILLAYGLGALTFLLVKGNEYGWSSNKIIFLMITSLVSIIIFLIYERKIPNAMIDFSLFKTKSYTASIILISIIFFAYMPISYLMNFYLENQLGYSVLKSGLIIGITSATSFIMSPIFALISKKTSPRVVSLFAIVFISLGDLMFIFMNSSNNTKIIYIAFVILGLGMASTTPLYQSAFEEISIDKNGIASGVLNSLRQLTACIAIALVSTLSTHYTNIAIDNTKNKIIEKVNENVVLEQEVKNTLYDKISDSSASKGEGFSKEMVHNLVSQKEKTILPTVPQDMQEAVLKRFQEQEIEINKVLGEATKIKEDESNKVFIKCFMITGIIALFGLFVVPFNISNEIKSGKKSKAIA